MSLPRVSVRRAETAEEIAAVKAIFLDYLRFVEDFLGESLSFQGTETEFATFPGVYDALWLASVDDTPVGAVGIKPFRDDICELKRLFVRPAGRGHTLGRRLTEASIRGARDMGYVTIYLDTNAGLTHANAVYEGLGFRDIASYYDNPLGDSSRYMALAL